MIINEQGIVSCLEIIVFCIQIMIASKLLRKQRIYNVTIFIIKPHRITPVFKHNTDRYRRLLMLCGGCS